MQLKMQPETSRRMATMGIVCAFLIVCNHLNPFFGRGTVGWWWDHIVGNAGLASVAVPYFFVAAGFFLAGHFEENGWWGREVRKRLASLVVPFFCWNVVAYAYALSMRMLMNYLMHRSIVAYIHISPSGILSALGFNLYNQPAAGQLWFVRSLFLTVLLSPVLFWAIRKFRVAFVVLVFALYAFLCPWEPTAGSSMRFFRWFFSLEGLFYFTVGCCLRLGALHFSCRRRTAGIVFAGGMLLFVLSTAASAAGCQVLSVYARLVGIPIALVGLWFLMPDLTLPRFLVGMSFPVYVLHPYFNAPLNIVSSRFRAVRFLYDTIGGWLLTAIVVFCASALMAKGMKRILPRASVVLFGGRS